MTTITAAIVADSISPAGKRLTTMLLRYPRWIHAELMTHRVFSRNASSSRAIPVSRLIDDIIRDPAVPMFWGQNQKGMQAGEEINASVHVTGVNGEPTTLSRENAWCDALYKVVEMARAFDAAGYHKQIVNRLLEPFSHINVVVTATEWSNFYALRRHKDAEPHIRLLADRMFEAQKASTPKLLRPGEWHLPFVTDDEADAARAANPAERVTEQEWHVPAIKLSVARCARTSYLTHDGKAPTIAGDLELYDRLVGGVPLHASPAEHQGTPDEQVGPDEIEPRPRWMHGWQHGNLHGWRQFRKMLPGESQ